MFIQPSRLHGHGYTYLAHMHLLSNTVAGIHKSRNWENLKIFLHSTETNQELQAYAVNIYMHTLLLHIP